MSGLVPSLADAITTLSPLSVAAKVTEEPELYAVTIDGDEVTFSTAGDGFGEVNSDAYGIYTVIGTYNGENVYVDKHDIKDYQEL